MNLCNPEGFKAEIKQLAEAEDSTEFFIWFDGGDSIDAAFKKADIIFKRLMLPHAKKHLKDLADKVSLDIGYGSGAQVLAASEHFQRSYGIDVHEERPLVVEELENRGAEDFELLVCDGKHIPMEDDQVDFIHSWTTFLHLNGIENVASYLEEIKRVLKPQGVAIIYFTRLIRSKSGQTESEYHADIALENEERLGYRYGGDLTTVRSIAMIVAMWKMVELAEKSGLEVLDRTFSYEGKGKSKRIYGQHGIVLRNPDVPVEEEPTSKEESESSIQSTGSDFFEDTEPPKKSKKKKTTIRRRKPRQS